MTNDICLSHSDDLFETSDTKTWYRLVYVDTVKP